MTPRLAILADFPEEHWPSMDLMAEMLTRHLEHSTDVAAARICASFKGRLGFLGGFGRNIDRLLNRMWIYPRYLRKRVAEFDCFHLVDHSYGQLVHVLPADRTGVFCHDLDTFRCLIEPKKDPRPRWFRAMTRKILKGVQKARAIFYLTGEIRRQIEAFGLFDPARLVCAPPAAAAEFTASSDPQADAAVADSIIPCDRFLMHVGSCIARKRIDVLLESFAEVRRPGLKLLQVGGEFTPEQRQVIERRNLADGIVQVRGLTRLQIAALYRRATLVLQPSEAEGFGLPVVEALACGASVVASDIPVLREVGGNAAVYCPTGDIASWSDVVDQLLEQRLAASSREARLAQAAQFSWPRHAGIISQAYRAIHEGTSAAFPAGVSSSAGS